MKIALLVLIIAVLLCAQFLFGYTTIRFPCRRKNGKKRVVCVGDSITYGYTVPLFFLQRYPAVLQRLLGNEVQVGVFGVSDRTLQSTGNKPYRRERAFQQSKEFLCYVFISLFGLILNALLMWFFTEFFNLWFMISKAYSVSITLFYNFFTRKLLLHSK